MKAIPLKSFYITRHGETVANAAGTAAGSLDTPLTERGRDQARALRAVMAFLSPQPEVIVHSSLSRARETAVLLGEGLALPRVEKESLVERSFGDWVGLPWGDVCTWLGQSVEPPNGEREADFLRRAANAVADVLSSPALPLIVTHGGIFDAIAARYDCVIEDIKNCLLYEFQPAPAQAFPWDVWHWALAEDGKVERRRADHMIVLKA